VKSQPSKTARLFKSRMWRKKFRIAVDQAAETLSTTEERRTRSEVSSFPLFLRGGEFALGPPLPDIWIAEGSVLGRPKRHLFMHPLEVSGCAEHLRENEDQQASEHQHRRPIRARSRAHGRLAYTVRAERLARTAPSDGGVRLKRLRSKNCYRNQRHSDWLFNPWLSLVDQSLRSIATIGSRASLRLPEVKHQRITDDSPLVTGGREVCQVRVRDPVEQSLGL